MLDARLNDIRWPARLHAAARSNPGFEPLLASLRAGEPFRDELGQQRATDRALVHAAAGTNESTPLVPSDRIDEQLWSAQTTAAARALIDLAGDGPLHEPEGRGAIEVWSATEFCAIHALWSIGLANADAPCLARAIHAARWHVEHTQPDNATNTPWGIHVFALANPEDSHEGDMLAQTLLHNCIVQEGYPDNRSALILEHAGAEMIRFLTTTSGHPTTPD